MKNKEMLFSKFLHTFTLDMCSYFSLSLKTNWVVFIEHVSAISLIISICTKQHRIIVHPKLLIFFLIYENNFCGTHKKHGTGTKLAQNFREKWLLPAGQLGRSDSQIGRSYSAKLRHFLTI